jgi:hypothetical protein
MHNHCSQQGQHQVRTPATQALVLDIADPPAVLAKIVYQLLDLGPREIFDLIRPIRFLASSRESV